jgi:hypothetical protein
MCGREEGALHQKAREAEVQPEATPAEEDDLTPPPSPPPL